ncbi:hypothetical protein [Gordonia liuliyuniae]|uniref:Phosphodiesterase n=1 Tax=Gordonia liuliyuniae TaxID=2911517 RepID=A0ABS9IQM5_9ACTN|nr:hypothetical protein [Gordonia liuliyuniae]MCF8587852.1 hypothetical protein [Gordonia liuliyuniae]
MTGSRFTGAAERIGHAVASLRSGRAVHRRGLTLPGSATVERGVLPIGSGPVTLRVSKGIGAPGALPDLVGVAVRFAPETVLVTSDSGPWDLLMTGPVRRVAGIPIPTPTRGWGRIDVSALTEFRHDEATWRIAGRLTCPPTPPGLDLDSLAAALHTQEATLSVTASRDRGQWTQLATVVFGGDVVADDIAFDPSITPHSVEPVPGRLTDIRRAAYRGSRHGRDR